MFEHSVLFFGSQKHFREQFLANFFSCSYINKREKNSTVQYPPVRISHSVNEIYVCPESLVLNSRISVVAKLHSFILFIYHSSNSNVFASGAHVRQAWMSSQHTPLIQKIENFNLSTVWKRNQSTIDLI